MLAFKVLQHLCGGLSLLEACLEGLVQREHIQQGRVDAICKAGCADVGGISDQTGPSIAGCKRDPVRVVQLEASHHAACLGISQQRGHQQSA